MRASIALLMTISLAAAAATDLPLPPAAKKAPKELTAHGDKRTDNYFWLREKENPAVIEHLKAENAYTDAVMKPTVRMSPTTSSPT